MKFALAIALFSSSFVAFAEETVVIPVPYADRLNGNSALHTPFGDRAPSRYQQVYDASEFSEISGDGGLITGLAFRFEGRIFSTSSSSVQINLSTTDKMPDNLSARSSRRISVQMNKPFLGLGRCTSKALWAALRTFIS